MTPPKAKQGWHRGEEGGWHLWMHGEKLATISARHEGKYTAMYHPTASTAFGFVELRDARRAIEEKALEHAAAIQATVAKARAKRKQH